MSLVGVEKAYWSKNTQDDRNGVAYATPIYLPGVQEIDFDAKYDTAKQYAENKLWKQCSQFTEAALKLNLADLTNNNTAEMTGGHIAATGGVYYTDHDLIPDGAILYSAPKDNGAMRYGIFYKGQFTPMKRTAKTKEDKTTFQEPELNGTFSSLKYNGLTEYHIDSDDPNCPPNIADTFFNSVFIPDADSAAPVATSSPVDNGTLAASGNVVVTFDKALSENTVNGENIFLMKADGTEIATAITIDSSKKVVTINPNADLVPGQYIAVVTKNVKSANNIALTAKVVINFTV